MFLKRFIFLFILTIFTGNAMAENANEKLLIELSHGDVVVELHSDIAPLHVDRIKTLAKDGFYDGIIFHRVIEGFMAQTGDPTGTGYGGSDYPDLRAEFSNKPFERGTIGMARSSNPNSGNSQFFICFEPAPFLNGQYTVWGTVIEGMENVDKIARGEPPANPDKIIKMTVVE
jgi:peptidylprolyl isomerase